MQTAKIIEKRINKIWSKNESLTDGIPPLAVNEIPSKSIIFVGINPSLDDNDKIQLKASSNKDLDYYSLPSVDSAEKTHPYFDKFYSINKQLKIPIGHIDLLYSRGTNQNDIKKIIKTEPGKKFVYEQLMTTKKLIDEIIRNCSPIAFVVNNAFARDLMGKFKHPNKYGDLEYHPIMKEEKHWMGYLFEWKDQIGTYVLKVGNRDIPFFFSGMLTGKRALDIGSFDRLVWHIKYYLDYSKKT